MCRHVRGVHLLLPATLLVVDAWFDITTSPSGAEFFWVLVMAAVAELPLAVARGWLAHHTEHICRGTIDVFLGHTKRWC